MLLRGHLQLAEKYQKPVTVHCRNAFNDTTALFREFFGKVRGVMHSFTYGLEEAEKVWELGWMIGINGIVTYPSASNLRDFILNKLKVAQISTPSELYKAGIVLETDAPYLSPEPERAKRNEPEAVKRLFGYLAHN
jgi:TatD DNase family protein